MEMTGWKPLIVDEDNHILVVVKPANLPAQADASGDPDLLSILKEHIRQRDKKPGNVYLGLVHRLDRPTSGLMVFAKTSKAAARLARALQEDRMTKEYLAVLRGIAPGAADGGWTRWTDWLVKDGASNTVRVADKGTAGAKEAILTLQCVAVSGGLSLVRVRLETGRSHQIRVQAASRGLPLWGDMRYDEAHNRAGMQLALCACRLVFPHPVREAECSYSIFPPTEEPWNRFSIPDGGISETAQQI